MKTFQAIITMTSMVFVLFLVNPCYSFSSTSANIFSSLKEGKETRLEPLYSNRRSFINTSVATAFSTFAATTIVSPNDIANALPMVTVFEFEKILKDSAKSVSGVTFSGPKLDIVVVTLIDGTQFGISDIYESPTDPRSPLKLIATCRSYKIPTKSLGLEEAVLSLSSSGSKKKVVYMNERVRVAAEKEREKKLRMEQDELDRQAELEQMSAGQN